MDPTPHDKEHYRYVLRGDGWHAVVTNYGERDKFNTWWADLNIEGYEIEPDRGIWFDSMKKAKEWVEQKVTQWLTTGEVDTTKYAPYSQKDRVDTRIILIAIKKN